MTEADLESLVDLPITPLGLAGIYVGEDVEAVVARIGEPITRGPSSQAPDEKMEFIEYGPFSRLHERARLPLLGGAAFAKTAAAQASIASGVNHTVRLPRARRAASVRATSTCEFCSFGL